MNARFRQMYTAYLETLRDLPRHPGIRLVAAHGNAPERYVVEYQVKSLEVNDNGKLVGRREHRVEITLPPTFPRQAPQAKMLTPVFHPNIDREAIDTSAFQGSLLPLMLHIGRLLAYQEYHLEHALNPAAARWAEQNGELLPLDGIALNEAVAELDLEPVVLPREGDCANCGQLDLEYPLVQCPQGHWLCHECNNLCARCQAQMACGLCGALECSICGRTVCHECGAPCSGCGVPICSDCEHTCGESVSAAAGAAPASVETMPGEAASGDTGPLPANGAGAMANFPDGFAIQPPEEAAPLEAVASLEAAAPVETASEDTPEAMPVPTRFVPPQLPKNLGPVMPCFVDTESGTVYWLSALQESQGRGTIGRNAENTIRIAHASVSRLHCYLEWTPQGLLIEDATSKNGTFVNGHQVMEALLKPGDQVRVGSINVSFEMRPAY